MKRIGGKLYLDGIYSLQIFSDMLGQVLKHELPGVKLKRVSAYDWRGYQIVKYPGFKDRHFFCQIYLGNPKLLIFQEYFEMVNYPFQIEFNLMMHGFFNLPYEEQKIMMSNFVKQAVQEAVEWCASDRRRGIVPESHW